MNAKRKPHTAGIWCGIHHINKANDKPYAECDNRARFFVKGTSVLGVNHYEYSTFSCGKHLAIVVTSIATKYAPVTVSTYDKDGWVISKGSEVK